MKKNILFFLLFAFSFSLVYARESAVLNGRGELINYSGRVQPVLKNFFGVELASTSLNVARAILNERYGSAAYDQQYQDIYYLSYKVYWYDEPVKASFSFKKSDGKWILESIHISCDENTLSKIVTNLNRDYGKGDEKNDLCGFWGRTVLGCYYAIESPKLGGKIDGFYIHSR